jgi:hypothetical protein
MSDNGPFPKIMSAREAMANAISCVQDSDDVGARLWLDIARELREGSSTERREYPLRIGGIVKPRADVEEWFVKRHGRTARKLRGPAHAHLDAPCTEDCYEPIAPAATEAVTERFYLNTRTDAVNVPPERAETVVMQRAQDEATPAYEEAGQMLGDTRSLPRRIATPSVIGSRDNQECGDQCGTQVVWVDNTTQWRHDIQGWPLACPEQG